MLSLFHTFFLSASAMSLCSSPSLSPSFTIPHIPCPIIFPALQSLSLSHPFPLISSYFILSPFLFHNSLLSFSTLLFDLFLSPYR